MYPNLIYRSGGFYDGEVLLSQLYSAQSTSPAQVRLTAQLYDNANYVRDSYTSISGKDEQFVSVDSNQHEQLERRFCVAAGCIAVEIDNCYSAKTVLYTSISPEMEVVYETFRSIDRPYTSLIKDDIVHECFRDDGRHSVYVASVGSSNYGHWLTDDLPRLKVLSEIDDPITLYLPAFGDLMNNARRDAANMIAGSGRDLIVRFIDPEKTYRFEKLVYVTA